MIKYFVYVLLSEKDNQFYTGYSTDLKRRIQEHNLGKVTSTKHRIPFILIYYEVCFNQQDSIHREKYLKSTYGKRYIRNRLKKIFGIYFTGKKGKGRYSKKEFKNFLYYARGSAYETVTLLNVFHAVSWITDEKLEELENDAFEIISMIKGLINSIGD